MGRQNRVDLPYFELDCRMDTKIELIEAEFGLKGFAIVIKLYQHIYGGEYGYYCEWTPDLSLLWAARYGASHGGENKIVSVGGYYASHGDDNGRLDCMADKKALLSGFPDNLINKVVAASIRRDIFSEDLFRKYGILTSSGIQKQYLKATVKRESVEMKKEYLLISVPENRKNVTINPISGGRNPISGGRNTQSKSNSKSKSNSYKNREKLHRIEDFISAYPKECNRYLTETAYCALVSSGAETEDNLVSCAENYAEACRIQETPERYIKNAENFLKDMAFEKYLLGKYRRPDAGKPKNGFNNFSQRKYDYEELEKQLLNSSPGGG